MITAIREVRRARRLTLEEVAARCAPPTTAQTIGRLETGTRTVSLAWLNRIAAALEVEAADLVRLPDRPDIAVAAILDDGRVVAPHRAATVVPPRAEPELVAITVTVGVGDYRAGDSIWCRRVPPERFAAAVNRDILVPAGAGGFVFGRLLAGGHDALQLLPPGGSARMITTPRPAWIAVAERLVRNL